MLECTPEILRMEREAAMSVARTQLRAFEDMTAAYAGPFSHRGCPAEEWPENNLYEFVSSAIGQIIEHNPRTKVTSRRSAPRSALMAIEERLGQLQEMVVWGEIDPMQAQPIAEQLFALHERLKAPGEAAKAEQYGLNRWVRAINGRETLDLVAHDMLFGHGVMMTTRQATPDNEPRKFGGSHWPAWARISPQRFFFDPLCLMFGGARYAGHDVIVGHRNLLKRAKENTQEGWNLKALRELEPDGNVADVRTEAGQTESQGRTPPRGEVAYSMIWVPEKQLDGYPGREEGFHGTVYTLAVNHEGGWLREPFPYYGPPWGPYTLFGVYRVPNSPFPLAPLAATLKQEKDLNEVVRTMNMGAKRYKRIMLVGDENVARKINQSPHDYAMYVAGLKPEEIHVIEVGGVTEQQIKQSVMNRERLRRARGQTETELGNVQGMGQKQPSATRDAIAAEAASGRMATIKHRFNDAAEMALRSAGWILWHDDTARFALGEEAAAELGGISPEFIGGHEEGQSFEDLTFDIDMYSTGRTNEREQRQLSLELFEQVLRAAPVMVATPHIEWGDLFENMGEARNQPNMGEIIKEEVLHRLQAMQMPAMAGPGGGGSGGGEATRRGLPGNTSGARAASMTGAA